MRRGDNALSLNPQNPWRASSFPPRILRTRDHIARKPAFLQIRVSHFNAIDKPVLHGAIPHHDGGANRSGSFSVERLMDFLTALGQDVEITVRPTRKDQGEVSVVA